MAYYLHLALLNADLALLMQNKLTNNIIPTYTATDNVYHFVSYNSIHESSPPKNTITIDASAYFCPRVLKATHSLHKG
jgi:ABC-type uncharacterized transport system fused permease/ATPase subunit